MADDKIHNHELLGCAHIWVPVKGNERQENEARNQMKLSAISESTGVKIRLLAQTGYSFLCSRGIFYTQMWKHLDQDGTLDILIPGLSMGDIILTKEEIQNKEAKYAMSMNGYSRLKKEFGDQINLKTIDFDIPATILITKNFCFFEPYTGITADREKLLFISFEMLFDKRIAEHGYNLMKKYFSHLYSKAEGICN